MDNAKQKKLHRNQNHITKERPNDKFQHHS